jgi:hypothetical protein
VLDRWLCRCAWCVVNLTVLAACSAAGNHSGDGTTSPGEGGAGAGTAGFTPFDGGPTGGQGGTTSCPVATQLVYTLTADNRLYSFDPPTLTFSLIGTLDCPGLGESPYSMAVDRNANAWSVFTDGNLYRIDTDTAHCTATSFVPGQHGWTTFGMGFSADSPEGNTDTLYVSEAAYISGGGTQGLGKIDLVSMTLTPIGMYDLLDARAELTGTGDAKLFGAFEGSPYDVAQIDKTNAHILTQAPQNAINYAPDTSNFAFAFWGGDFWLFVGPGTSTDVFHYQPSTQTTTKVKTVDMEIVGAGVSTCAPIVPPT